MDTTTSSPQATVRINWMKFMYYSWKRFSAFSRFVFISKLLFFIGEIATGIAILAVSRNESCEQPLQTYIIVYVIKVAISIPSFIGRDFQRAARRLRRNRERLRRREQIRRRRQQPEAEVGGTEQELEHDAMSFVEPQSSRCCTLIGAKLEMLLDLFSVLWFIVGNYMLFTSTRTCRTLAPKQYYTTLTYVLINYSIVLFPLLFCTSVVFCLPCVMGVLSVLPIRDDLELDLEEDAAAERIARQEAIKKLPIYRYVDTDNDEPVIEDNKKKSKWDHAFKTLFRRKHNDTLNATEKGNYEEMFIQPKEDALCCICLAEYGNNNLICKLWCGHHYHHSCLTEWLGLNRRCPLCKQDFRGREYEDEDDDMTTQEVSTSSA